MNSMSDNIAVFTIIIISFPLSILTTYLYIKVALKFNLLSQPHPGGVRQENIPTSGGIAFGLLYCLILFIYNQFFSIPDPYKYSIFIGSGLMILIGFLDDIYGLSSLKKLIFQFLFMFLIAYFFDIHIWIMDDPNQFNFFIIFLFLLGSIWLINTFNFIDGADGLVSTNSAIFSLVAGSFFFLSGESTLAVCLWILSCINLGFLVFNWAPAKVFMGDSGALLLGSLFVIFIIGSGMTDQIPIWSWLTLLSIFYVETTVTLMVRLWRRENAFKVHHKLHAYQRQIITTGDHSRPAKISVWMNVLWTVPLSFACYFHPQYGVLITLIACIPLSIVFYIFGPYQTSQ
jgi:UDP-N-acetylmuramyl pentapeptide phosphotransferase/UDP-N-acetylglucosamine-1-phosphate transferase